MSRTHRGTAAFLAALAPLAALLAGCAADDGAASPSLPSATASSAPAPAPTPESKSPEDLAVEQAEVALREYYRVSTIAWQDPESFRIDHFKQIAITQALLDLENKHIALTDQGLRQTGSTELVSVEVQDVDLTHKPKSTPPVIPTVEFSLCFDTSNLDVRNADGESVRETAGGRGMARVRVSDYAFPDGPWLVSYIEYLDEEQC